MGSRRTISLIGLLIVALIVWVDADAPSPGPISGAHARDPALQGRSGCATCHGDGHRDMSSSCLRCHEGVDAELAEDQGFHAQVDQTLVNGCERCHSEHHGRDFRIIGDRSFMVAGYEDRDAYDHRGLHFTLQGAHLDLSCAACHELADVAELPAGTKRFTSVGQDCVSCHDDPHGGEQPDCARCHGQQEKFQVVPSFEHDPDFPLAGGHAGVACVDCHQRGTDHSVDEVLSAGAPSHRECADCHDAPHAEGFLSGVASSLGLTEQQSCARCHPIVKTAFHAPLAELDRELHACTGFPLVAPHQDIGCEECHEGYGKRTFGPAGWDEWDFNRLYPGRHPDGCTACHGDPHEGGFDAGPFAGGDCLVCHERRGFQPPRFTLAQHDRTRFPLTGGHRAVGCNDCHRIPAPEAARQFRGTPRTCETCHVDVHHGAFDGAGLPRRIGGRSGCARCHTTESFASVDHEQFDHDLFTGFPLRGAHASAKCGDCHRKDRADRALGRADRACSQCHEDPHAGQFTNPQGTDCARCHRDDLTFLDLAFDHERDSRFPLGQSHEHLACGVCHKAYPLPDGSTVVRYRPLGILCTDCHGDMRGDRRVQKESR